MLPSKGFFFARKQARARPGVPAPNSERISPKASGSRRLDHRPHLGASSLPGPAGARRHGPAIGRIRTGCALRPEQRFSLTSQTRAAERGPASRRPSPSGSARRPPDRAGWPTLQRYFCASPKSCNPVRSQSSAKKSCGFSNYQFSFAHYFCSYSFVNYPISFFQLY